MVVHICLESGSFPITGSLASRSTANLFYARESHAFGTMFIRATINVVAYANIYKAITIEKFVLFGVSVHSVNV
jgi:hypothetical protein